MVELKIQSENRFTIRCSYLYLFKKNRKITLKTKQDEFLRHSFVTCMTTQWNNLHLFELI